MSLLPTLHSESADPRLDALLRHAIVIGAVLVLLSPSARGMHAMIGWLPLWLLAMPLCAWWALHRFALPRWVLAAQARSTVVRRAVGSATARPRATRNRHGQRRMPSLGRTPSGSRAAG